MKGLVLIYNHNALCSAAGICDVSEWRSRGHEFDPCLVPYFGGCCKLQAKVYAQSIG